MTSPREIRRAAREAGGLYLAMSLLAILAYFRLGRLFLAPGDPAATARNILAHEHLYRIGLLVDLVAQVLFILVALALYRLFEGVDRRQARLMVGLVGTGIAAGFANFALSAAPLVILGDDVYRAAFDRAQLEALAYAALSLGGRQGELLTFLWGLWLFPFAALTIRSGFLPKFLGVLLIVTGVAYVASCVAAVGFPEHVAAVRRIAFPLYFGEFLVVLWLALVGARPKAAPLG